MERWLRRWSRRDPSVLAKFGRSVQLWIGKMPSSPVQTFLNGSRSEEMEKLQELIQSRRLTAKNDLGYLSVHVANDENH